MEFSIPNFGSYQLILIGVIFLLISFIFLRKYFKAFLIYDLGDSILSFVDEPFGGVAMLDWGDWIMAFFIFTKYKKIVGVAIAILLAIEAGMFIPGLDYVTNFIPAVDQPRNKKKSLRRIFPLQNKWELRSLRKKGFWMM